MCQQGLANLIRLSYKNEMFIPIANVAACYNGFAFM